MRKLNEFIDTIPPVDLIVSLIILLWCVIGAQIINVRLPYTTLNRLAKGIHFICVIFALAYVFIRRWYNNATDRSLTVDLLSPDYQGNLIQLVMRARRYKQVTDKNISRGRITAKNADGIVLGTDEHSDLIVSPSSGEEHILGLGGSGSGKSTACFFPTLMNFRGSKFIVDISEDLPRGYLERATPLIIEPGDDESCAFDVLHEIDLESDMSKKMILLKELAESVVPESEPTLSGDSIFYQRSAHYLFYAALIFYYEAGLDFCHICYKISEKPINELIERIKKYGAPNARFALTGMGEIRPAILSSINQNLGQQIELFATSSQLRKILRRADGARKTITPIDLENRDIVLRIPQEKINFFTPFIKLVTEQILRYCTQRPLDSERKILLALDEFAALGYTHIIEPLRTLRKRGVRIMILTQSLADIEEIYGVAGRRIICDNCRIKLIFESSDADTSEYLSRLIGTREISACTRSYSGTSTRHIYSIQTRPSIYPEDFSRLRDKLIVIMPDGYMKLIKSYYWENNEHFNFGL